MKVNHEPCDLLPAGPDHEYEYAGCDARPVATLVEADTLPPFPEMTWVKITGVPTFPIEKGRRISVLKAEKVEKTEPPAESMIY